MQGVSKGSTCCGISIDPPRSEGSLFVIIDSSKPPQTNIKMKFFHHIVSEAAYHHDIPIENRNLASPLTALTKFLAFCILNTY